MTVAFIFTGQGSPSPGAGRPWRQGSSWQMVDEVASAAKCDVARLLLDADEADLVDTANAQLATFTLCLMIWQSLVEAGSLPEHVAGHSLGEFTALVAAGVLSVEDGARVVSARGKAMRAACEAAPSGMAALLGLDLDAVTAVCETVDDVWVANDNAPGQVVIAGTLAALEAAGDAAKGAGARRPIPLKVAGAFHTPLMDPAQEALDAALGTAVWADPTCGTWSNVDASLHTHGAGWSGRSSAQLCSPVRWREEILAMDAAGVDTFVEVGPGTVLSGMVKRISPDVERFACATPDEVGSVTPQLFSAG